MIVEIYLELFVINDSVEIKLKMSEKRFSFGLKVFKDIFMIMIIIRIYVYVNDRLKVR